MTRREFLGRGPLAAAGALAGVKGWRRSAEGGPSSTRSPSPFGAGPPLRILTLEGAPRDRGRIHGEALRAEIREIQARWRDGVKRYPGLDPDVYIDDFLKDTNFLPAIRAWAPGLIEEVEGLAEGAGLDFKTMLVHQLADEDWWYSRQRALEMTKMPGARCSALGIHDPGARPLLAQNMDLLKLYDGSQVLLRIKRPGSSLESLVYSFAGFLGLTGLNSRPLGICCNTLLQLNHSPAGLPVAFVVRRVLESANVAEAEDVLKRLPHASGQNYTIADSRTAAAWECSAGKVSRFLPFDGATRVYHTNHPLANDDQSDYLELLRRFPPKSGPRRPTNSEVRLEFLARSLGPSASGVDVAAIKGILASPSVPICFNGRNPDDLFTFGCLVMELSPEPVLHLAPGPPCVTEFREYRFGEASENAKYGRHLVKRLR